MEHEVLQKFQKLNLKILPKTIVDLINKADKISIIRLKKLEPALIYYGDFSKNYFKRTSILIKVDDKYDFIAYMIKNSNLDIQEKSEELKLSLELFEEKNYTDAMNEMASEKLMSMAVNGFQKIYNEFLEEINNKLYNLEKIQAFEKNFLMELNSDINFIDNHFIFSKKRLRNFYNCLDFNEKTILADFFIDTISIDLSNKTSYFIIVLKTLANLIDMEVLISTDIFLKNPYLCAICGNEIDIVNYCIRNLSEIDSEMLSKRILSVSKLLGKNPSEIAKKEKILREKCLIIMQDLKYKIEDLISGSYLKNGSSL